MTLTFISMAEIKFAGARVGDGEFGHSTLTLFPTGELLGQGDLSQHCASRA